MRVRSAPVLGLTLAAALTGSALLALSPAAEPAGAVAPVADPSIPPAVATSGQFTVVVLSSGGALAAGSNSFGTLADGTTTSRTTPVEVRGASGPLTDMVQAAVGKRHTLLLRADGTVLAAGDDDRGQLGRGTTTGEHGPHPVPLPVVSATGTGALSRIVQVAATDEASFALAADGTVWSWGVGGQYVLGRPGSSAVPVPGGSALPVPGRVVVAGGSPLTGITRISCSGKHCLGLASSGRLYAWGAYEGRGTGGDTGDHASAVTGQGTSSLLLEPVRAMGTTGRQSYAVGPDGVLYGWGDNAGDTLGVPDGGVTFVNHPAVVVADDGTPVTGIARIDGSDSHTVAVTQTGGVLVWGSSQYGQIGPLPDGALVRHHPSPLVLPDGAVAAAADAGRWMTLIQTQGGGAIAVGQAPAGAMLLGDTTAASAPTASSLTGIGLPRLRVLDDPWLNGKGALGATLSVANLRVSPFPTSVTYQWYRSGTPIRGATRATYTITLADVTAKLSARITVARAGYGTAATRTDERYVERPRFRVVSGPVISGRGKVGARLTASPGSYRPAPASVVYRWTRDGGRIRGATARTYVTVRADRGHRIRVVVTVAKAPYVSQTRVSNAILIR